MASLISKITTTMRKHIITIEDPIEYIFPNDLSIVEQREVGNSTKSFENGLKYALRQASDVIMI
ncbi:MAG: type IV pilus twitching motility protein PilT [Candidatus Peribacteria bacterium]|nr:type IV pilus twitching motility protein PilT [Candidatus Peribacteria bacterium]